MSQAFYLVNEYQKQGYHNIGVCQTIYNKDGQHVLEDYVTDVEFMVNTSQTERIYKSERALEQATKELEIYKTFIEKYKAEKLLETFIEEKN